MRVFNPPCLTGSPELFFKFENSQTPKNMSFFFFFPRSYRGNLWPCALWDCSVPRPPSRSSHVLPEVDGLKEFPRTCLLMSV